LAADGRPTRARLRLAAAWGLMILGSWAITAGVIYGGVAAVGEGTRLVADWTRPAITVDIAREPTRSLPDIAPAAGN